MLTHVDSYSRLLRLKCNLVQQRHAMTEVNDCTREHQRCPALVAAPIAAVVDCSATAIAAPRIRARRQDKTLSGLFFSLAGSLAREAGRHNRAATRAPALESHRSGPRLLVASVLPCCRAAGCYLLPSPLIQDSFGPRSGCAIGFPAGSAYSFVGPSDAAYTPLIVRTLLTPPSPWSWPCSIVRPTQ